MKYLDPKNDLTFKKIFGDHPHLLISFLNAMLPLEKDQEIVSIEYVDSEIIPELPGFKRSIVDVNCFDNQNRRFIVEMQMYWTSSFKSRMFFNAGKAYVKQLKKGRHYKNLCPVYGLSLVNENFQTSKDMAQTYYHHYKMSHSDVPDDYIKGIELIFIELEKFKTLNFRDKRLHVLWLRFLTEIDEDTTTVADDLLNETVIHEALETVQESAFTEAELEYYEKYWDSIRIEQIALDDARDELKKTKENILKALEQQEKVQKLREEEQKLRKEEQKLRKEEQKRREEEQKRREEEQKLREEEQKLREEEQRQREEEQRQKENERKQKENALKTIETAVLSLFEKNTSITDIAQIFQISEIEVKNIFEQHNQ